jgi:beta-glucosidase
VFAYRRLGAVPSYSALVSGFGRRARIVPLLVGVLAAIGALGGTARAAGRCGAHSWCKTSLSPDRRADLLLKAMTETERIGLLGGDDLGGVAGGEHAHTGTQDGVPRLGVPKVLYSDGPQGPRQGKTTGLPAPLGLAATWDAALARRYGGVVAAEAKAKGNDVVFGPTVNILRTPLNGRTFEAYGEDPFLDSRMTVGWIEGAQAQGVIADVKHLAENNQEGYSPAANESAPGQVLGPPTTEGSRMLTNVTVSERTLREVELRAFEAAVREAHVGTVMCSYNKVNGTYACQNRHLLTDVLQGWGFKGFVLSDYGAVHDLAPSLKAGLAFEPWPGLTFSSARLRVALLARQISRTDVDRAVHRMLRTFFAHRLFDRATYRDDDAQIAKKAHAATARKIEEDAATLLVNRRGTLPLSAKKLHSVALLGAGIDRFVTGGGSGNVTPFRTTTLVGAVRARVGPGVKVLTDDGSDATKAAGLARQADVAIVATPDYLTEGTDRACLTLECPHPYGDQDALIRAVAAANRRTVVVLETGGPVLTPWRGTVAALLEAWYPGQEGGSAIARVLFGAADPGGRLPATFPATASQEPTAGNKRRYPGIGNEQSYSEGLLVGYRWWDAKRLRPAFPFGFGLSYTHFALGKPHAKRHSHRRFDVTLRVRNTGARGGTAVIQLYVTHPKGSGEPVRQLAAFAKARIGRGRSRVVHLRLTPTSVDVWSARRNAWTVKPGRYRLSIGTSSRSLPRKLLLRVR